MLLILLSIAFQALSLLVLGGGAWLLWDWYDADTVVLADGTAATLREDWKLWTAIALLAWSFLGRFILAPLLARADRERPGRKGESEKLQLDRAAASTLAVAEASLSSRTPAPVRSRRSSWSTAGASTPPSGITPAATSATTSASCASTCAAWASRARMSAQSASANSHPTSGTSSEMSAAIRSSWATASAA